MDIARITFRPLSSAGGVEVLGINLCEKQSKDIIKLLLKEACLKHSFLLLRNQDITWEEQFYFGGIFGDILEDAPTGQERNIVSSTGELLLHFDHWLIEGYPKPTHFTMLYGIEVVPVGGETILVNVMKAYNDLPVSLKDKIDNMQAIHYYDYSYSPEYETKASGRVRKASTPSGQPHAIHPVARIHPSDKSKKVLYISPKNTERILGIADEESEVVLQELYTYIEKPEYMYLHKWRVGDVLIWDNHAMLHGRTNYEPQYKRKLRRASIL